MTRSLRALAFVVVVGACATGQGRSARARGDEGVAWIRGPFKVRAGDDPSWASPALDDGVWASVDARLLPRSSVAGWRGVAWFRASIDVPPERAGRPVAMYGRFVGAAEVFIDGARAFSHGDPRVVAVTGSTPVDFALTTPRWVTFARPGRHLLAVRFASQHAAALRRLGFPSGFELAVSDGAVAPSAGRPLGTLFIGAVGALALLHLLLFFFHRDRRENLHYALAALGVACIAAFDGRLRWATTATEAVALLGAASAAITLSSLMLLRFYHAVFSREVPRSFWRFAALAVVVAASSFALPRAVAYAFAAVASVAQARVLLGAVARRASGAWIIAAGGVLCIAGAAWQMLGDIGWIPAPWGVYLYGFFALLGSMSVYLARDIADDRAKLARKLVEVEELSARQRDAMERYRTVFETSGTGMILLGEDGVISLANAQWARLTGYARDEVEGRMRWEAFFHDAERTARTREAELHDRDARVREGVVTISAVPGSSERVVSFLDLTDVKRAQREMARADRMAALGHLVAGVAHEINNPNNFIHFNLPILRRYIDAMRPHLEAELVRDPDLTLVGLRYEAFVDDLLKLIENMEHGSARITAIVADLRRYLRSGEDLAMTPGSVAEVVARAMALVGKQVSRMVERVEVEVREPLPLVKMNAGKVEQVLINLVINAAQAADKRDSWVRLCARAADAGDAVELVVDDNGSGIAAESLGQIFDPFFTTKGREHGTGLGLAIAQQIVAEHGGTLEVASERGVGARFTVRLPAATDG